MVGQNHLNLRNLQVVQPAVHPSLSVAHQPPLFLTHPRRKPVVVHPIMDQCTRLTFMVHTLLSLILMIRFFSSSACARGGRGGGATNTDIDYGVCSENRKCSTGTVQSSREGRSSVNSPRSLRCRRMQAGCLQVNDGTLCTARPQGGPETV